jgi:murein DD-endopeptidase MepM/ murein hydrolase activator NlpD
MGSDYMISFSKRDLDKEADLIKVFLKLQGEFLAGIFSKFLGWSDFLKTGTAKMMYRQRGRFSQSFVNISMAILSFLTIVFSGKMEELINSGNVENNNGNYLIMAADGVGGANTLISNLPKGEITEYRVQEGDTISEIAQKFGVSIDTIMWENNLKSIDSIKPKQILRILPVTGVKHTVKRGETIYSIAKMYQVDAQSIIDYPFNTFTNDETFALSAGQDLIIPDGIKPQSTIVDTQKSSAKTVAPIPGVVGEGNFMWPTSGMISQKFYWYHQAVDIANHSNPAIVAAQGGTVVTAGWNAGGYGNYVVIDHGNGYKTLYAHMLNNSVVVKAGQKVTQGQKLGTMGSTGRSTGTHLHFEVIGSKGKLDPLSVLK